MGKSHYAHSGYKSKYTKKLLEHNSFKDLKSFQENHYFQDWSKCRRGYMAQLSILCQRVVKFESPSETCESAHRGETI